MKRVVLSLAGLGILAIAAILWVAVPWSRRVTKTILAQVELSPVGAPVALRMVARIEERRRLGDHGWEYNPITLSTEIQVSRWNLSGTNVDHERITTIEGNDSWLSGSLDGGSAEKVLLFARSKFSGHTRVSLWLKEVGGYTEAGNANVDVCYASSPDLRFVLARSGGKARLLDTNGFKDVTPAAVADSLDKIFNPDVSFQDCHLSTDGDCAFLVNLDLNGQSVSVVKIHGEAPTAFELPKIGGPDSYFIGFGDIEGEPCFLISQIRDGQAKLSIIDRTGRILESVAVTSLQRDTAAPAPVWQPERSLMYGYVGRTLIAYNFDGRERRFDLSGALQAPSAQGP